MQYVLYLFTRIRDPAVCIAHARVDGPHMTFSGFMLFNHRVHQYSIEAYSPNTDLSMIGQDT